MTEQAVQQEPAQPGFTQEQRDNIESAIRSLRYGAHPHRSPHADDLESMLAAVPLAAPLRQIEDCPELNLSNYTPDDVDRLNDWAVRADAEIDRLCPKADILAGIHPVMQDALRGFVSPAPPLAAPAEPVRMLTVTEIDAVAKAQNEPDLIWFTAQLTTLEWRSFALDVIKKYEAVNAGRTIPAIPAKE